MNILDMTEDQFGTLLKLTSIHKGSKTHDALHKYIVLGLEKRAACEASGVTQQAINAALHRLTEVDFLARKYVDALAQQS